MDIAAALASLVEFKRLLLALSRTPGPWLGLGSGPPGPGRAEAQGGLQSGLGQIRNCLGASWQSSWEGGEIQLSFLLSPYSHPRQPHKEGCSQDPAGTRGEQKEAQGSSI